MAQNEADREDLLREATALVRRGEFRVPREPEPVTAGFRADGRMSIWFGTDPACHFDAAGGLRRAYIDGRLYRTQGTTLARLTRVRTPRATELQRHDLDPAELAAVRETIRARLATFAEALEANRASLLRGVPDDDDRLADELRDRIAVILAGPVPLAPAIRGKR
ncbi:MAG: hypothetical protein WD066_13535 [Planctomycetaceae bacterium]